MKKLSLLLLMTIGCALPLQQKAHIIAQSSKEVIDLQYEAWDKAASLRVTECETKLQPAENYTKADYDNCVGPFNETVQEKIVFGLKIVQAAQLAVFLALSQDKSDEEVQHALQDLTSAVAEFVKLVASSM